LTNVSPNPKYHIQNINDTVKWKGSFAHPVKIRSEMLSTSSISPSSPFPILGFEARYKNREEGIHIFRIAELILLFIIRTGLNGARPSRVVYREENRR